MKKIVCLILAVFLSFIIFACGKSNKEEISVTPEPEEKEVEIIDITTPEPVTTDPVPVTDQPEEKEEFDEDHYDPDKSLVKFELGDGADVDYVMTEIIDKWDDTSIIRDDGNGVVTYFVIPKEKGSKGDAIATVKAYDDDFIIREVTAIVFLDEADKHEEAVKKIYNYFASDFPSEFISNFNKDAWEVLSKTGESNYDRVKTELESMKEDETERFEHGSYNFEISVDSLSKAASFTFYSD